MLCFMWSPAAQASAGMPPQMPPEAVVVDAIVTGAVYADRGSLHVADEVRPILEQLRGCVARAIARAGGKAIGGGR